MAACHWGNEDMSKLKAAKAPLLWMALGWVLAALYIMGPRAALNRGLDKAYALSASVSSLF
jgi:hypothetical protein